ncbi:DNA primase [Bernardetia litoralis DSM 6794]|uniref:DNA primase n=1 Tax=Bernardetia litoralis (strain ATCC 23117 / DSM 6794 / NBRC 15988 / NCIMB 1366 / Fx l1 / Sio-4) TaxID=880071 RepID=I4AH88_BERLS|nr:DNA primase [Bernardetia litoralis]AFM03323.1 DNA primase [Bernardetia litoralis DSM 6794]
MSIPPHIIDQIRESSHIEEVVGDFVTLKKQGASFKACCPFHQEKTPSFVVTPSKGIFKCFGCGKGGDSITFVMEHENLSYPEALRFLAGKYSIEIPEENERSDEQKEEQRHKESLLIVLAFAQKFYTENLKNTDEGKAIGESYFRERGFIQKTQEKFELGYAFDEWDSILKAATEKGYSNQYLEDTGLIIKKEDRHYDRFRGRVMFPIHNVSGRTIGFGARALKKDQQPKYLNSPETEVYQKSHVLYGIFQAKNAIRKQENCYLVEGYTDVIGLHQAGIENVVSSSGTSLTNGQINLLKRFTDRVTLLFDGDKAGLKAAIRGIDIILEQGLDVQAVVLPDGHDPDTFVTEQGGESTQKYLESKAQNFLRFKYQVLVPDKDDPIARAGALKELCQTIAVVPDVFKRSLLTKELAHWMEINEQDVILETNKFIHRRAEQKLKEQEREQNKQQRERQQNRNTQSSSQNNTSNNLPTDEFGYFPPSEYEQGEYQQGGQNEPSYYEEFGGQAIDLSELEAAFNPQKKEERELTVFRQYEDEITRLLIRYGHETIAGGEYICDYILEEISEIPSLNLSYSQLRIIYENARINDIKISYQELLRDFIQNDEKLIQIVTGFLTDPSQISPNWEKRMQLVIPNEEKQLSTIIPQTILHLKRVYLKGILNENVRKIKKANNQSQEEIEKLLLIYQELKAQEIQISNELGIVIHK